MLVLDRRPLIPRPGEPERLRRTRLDTLLSALGIIGSVVIAGMNISACRSRWQFVCIGIWKLTLSFTLCSINLHQCFTLHMKTSRERTSRPAPLPRSRERPSRSDSMPYRRKRRWPVVRSFFFEFKRFLIEFIGFFKRFPQHAYWLALYFIGTVIGMVGLMSLVVQLFKERADIRIITGIFASIAFIPLGFWTIVALIYSSILSYQALGAALQWLWSYILYFSYVEGQIIKPKVNWHLEWYFKEHEVSFSRLSIGFTIATLTFGLFGAFYCDWVLAAIAGNWSGVPSSDVALLYWLYFASKRLPMLAT